MAEVIFNVVKYAKKFTILTILCVQFSGVKYIHTAVVTITTVHLQNFSNLCFIPIRQ